MNQDCPGYHVPDCAGGRSPHPINLPADPPPDDTGFLIVRFKQGVMVASRRGLLVAAKEAGLHALLGILEKFSVAGKALITSISPEELARLELNAADNEHRPLHSLSSYWRLDARGTPDKVDEIIDALRRLPQVELVYREKTPSDPVNAGDDTYAGSENYLDAAPTGIDARWVWTQPNGAATGMHFIDLEQGWLLGHEDLPGPTLIFNDNHDGVGGYTGNHGAAVLGEVAGVDNTRGIIGIAPDVTSVRTVSWWKVQIPAMSPADSEMMSPGDTR